jgi:hypothetical protein
MTIESEVFRIVSAVVGGRCFPDTAPLNTTRPYATYQQVGGMLLQPLAKVVADKGSAHMQINIWHSSRLNARLLEYAVESAMVTDENIIARKIVESVYEYDDDLKLFGFRMEFMCWYDKP